MAEARTTEEEKGVGKLRIRRPSILVTNDDGDSEGLRMLLEVAGRFGNAYAVIPSKQRSAIANAVTLHKPLRLHLVAQGIHAINGTPSDCVLFALYSGEFHKPDLVLSGINAGDNTSMNALIGSGTLGACWEAVLEGVPAIAFSMVMAKKDRHLKESWGDREALMKKVESIIETLLPKLDKDKERFFNVNMPERAESAEIAHINKLQKERFLTHVDKRIDPDGVPYYWISGTNKKVEKGTDTYEVIQNNKIVITEISLAMFEQE
ncbi:5'/3'-nucleotidase SurE [Candidatus Micrarchaeota archaeon]|nr:5'/3'-nucleotidase SurE [Candidatus Micrarchaeota archaeon]